MGIINSAGQSDFLGPSETDDFPKWIHNWRKRKNNFPLAEFRTFGSVTYIAHHGQIKSSGNGRASHRADNRLIAKYNSSICPVEKGRVCLVGYFLQFSYFIKVKARRKIFFPTGQHNNIYILSCAELGE